MSKANKITIYHIKEGLEIESIFKDQSSIEVPIKSNDNSHLFYIPKNVQPPKWVRNFFQDDFNDEHGNCIFQSTSTQAVLIKEIKIKTEIVKFAICFGMGHHLLNHDAIEPRFGLKIVLNMIRSENLRRVDKCDLSGSPKHVAEQLFKRGDIYDFGLDLEKDIVMGVVGYLDKKNPQDEQYHNYFGSNVIGKAYLSISTKHDINSIDELLVKSYDISKQSTYRDKGFEWIDNIEVVDSQTSEYSDICSKLDEILGSGNELGNIYLSIPELIDWGKVESFRFNNSNKEYSDLELNDIKKILNGNVTVARLSKIKIKAIDSNNELTYKWNAFQCLYAEITWEEYRYILLNKNWYKLKNEYTNSIDKEYQSILAQSHTNLQFSSYSSSDKNEHDYNIRIANELGGICLDGKNIPHGNRYSAVEFCDIYKSDDNELIHIKRYSGSASLSHLFNQGLVSSELLLNDNSYIEKVVTVANQSGGNITTNSINRENCHITFGIIKKSKTKNFELPFFSKITLKETFRRISGNRKLETSVILIDNEAS